MENALIKLLFKKIHPHIKVRLAYRRNNSGCKSVDVHGRTYKSVYEKFGHKVMVEEYLHGNTWLIK